MSIAWLSSKCFTQKRIYPYLLYRTSVIILTPLPLHPHIHSTVKLSRKGVLQTKRAAFFKKMCFQIFLERGERWRAADICRKRVPDFSCLKVEKSASSRFEVQPLKMPCGCQHPPSRNGDKLFEDGMWMVNKNGSHTQSSHPEKYICQCKTYTRAFSWGMLQQLQQEVHNSFHLCSSITQVPWEYSLQSTMSWGENTGCFVLLVMIRTLASFIAMEAKA